MRVSFLPEFSVAQNFKVFLEFLLSSFHSEPLHSFSRFPNDPIGKAKIINEAFRADQKNMARDKWK